VRRTKATPLKKDKGSLDSYLAADLGRQEGLAFIGPPGVK
jgi:hypothetical protein